MWREAHTDNQAFHLIFAQDIHVQRLLQPVVVFVGSSTCRNDTQLIRADAIEFLMLLFELLDKLDAEVYPVSLEVYEVQSPAIVSRVKLPREVDQLG